MNAIHVFVGVGWGWGESCKRIQFYVNPNNVLYHLILNKHTLLRVDTQHSRSELALQNLLMMPFLTTHIQSQGQGTSASVVLTEA